MEVEIPKWDKRFLDVAKNEIATWSKDPRSKLGAVAVIDRRIVATGYNGFPEGFPDDEELYNDREIKLKYVVHAEENAIYNAARNGVSLKGATLFVDGIATCSECAKAVIQSGIKRVVMRYKPMKSKWAASFEDTKFMFNKCGVEFVCYEIPSEKEIEYISIHTGQVYAGNRVETNEVDYEGYKRLPFYRGDLKATYTFPPSKSVMPITVTYLSISNADGIIKAVLPLFQKENIPYSSEPQINLKFTEDFWERHDHEQEENKRSLCRNESSGSTDDRNEAQPNVQEAVGVGRRHGSWRDILRKLCP
jgi:dCMP deaminase